MHCVHAVFGLLDMILGASHMDNCHGIQRGSMFAKVTTCDDQRVFVLVGQAVVFSEALWYHFASVLSGILNEQGPPHRSLIGLISYLVR